MEQILLSLEDAAIMHAQQYAPANHPIFNARVDAFKDGAKWKKEQDKELLNLARQLIHAYYFRHPDTNQLLVGYTNEEALLKFNTLYDIFLNA